MLVDDLRVRAVGRANHTLTPVRCAGPPLEPLPAPAPHETVSAYFEGGWSPTPVHMLTSLSPGHTVPGPAIIIQDITTIVVEPGCVAVITASGDIEITVVEASKKVVSVALDPIYLSIFSHRYLRIPQCSVVCVWKVVAIVIVIIV